MKIKTDLRAGNLLDDAAREANKTLDQVTGKCCYIYHNKWLFISVAQCVYKLGNQFLAGTAFTTDRDRRITCSSPDCHI